MVDWTYLGIYRLSDLDEVIRNTEGYRRSIRCVGRMSGDEVCFLVKVDPKFFKPVDGSVR